MKRFEQMKDSKSAIIEGTKKQLIQQSSPKRKTPIFYYMSFATVFLALCIGGYLFLQKAGPSQTVSQVQVIDISFEGKATLLVEKGDYTLLIPVEMVKLVSPLNEYFSTELFIQVTNKQAQMLQKELNIDAHATEAIEAIFHIENLYVKENVYYVEEINYIEGAEKQPYDPPMELQFNEKGEVILETRLSEVFATFEQSLNHDLLQGLSPMDIFYLYTHATQQQAFEVEYALIHSIENMYKPEFEQFVQERSREEDREFIHPFYGKEVTVQYGEFGAYKTAHLVEVSSDGQPGAFFGLIQNEEGIWLVNYLPMQ
jgi:hypothetical protein